ncbi:MAG: histidine phosphatase family protein [Myxococcota bacterium]
MKRQRWTLVRHGETEGESSIRLNGATDVALNDHGRAQMVRVASALRRKHFDMAYSSPLSRSHESAQIVAEPHVLPIDVVDGFRELNFGEWEGMTYEEVAARDPERLAQRQSDARDFTYPGGDSRESFEARVRAATRSVVGSAESVLLVLHKGVIKVALSELLGLPFEDYRSLPVDLASIHVVELSTQAPNYTVRNDTQHLGELHIADAVAPRQ